MGLNDTASAERLHIGFFGLRNAGKSSLVNAVTGQQLSVVSDFKGTTTDLVKKAMELLPLGPVVIIDTPGIDDEGELGELRVKKAKEALSSTDIAVLVCDATAGLTNADNELIRMFDERKTPYIIAYSKSDLLESIPENTDKAVYVSTKSGKGVHELKEALGKFKGACENTKYVVADLLDEGDTVILVIPIDAAAPKGRLILPQQQTIRDILEKGCIPVLCRDTELTKTLESLSSKPKMVITDSQAFGRVSKLVPEDTLLTSFSILFARYKGDLAELIRGAAQLSKLSEGDKILISEGCTHHRQCGDIGSVKIPAWIEKFSGVKPEYTFTSGGEYPDNLSEYKVCIHCGGCMLNEKEMQSRIERCRNAGVPIVNYGVAIAHMHGILKRSLEVFPDMLSLLD